MKIAICDDNRKVIDTLKGLIGEFFSEKNIPFELFSYADGSILSQSGEKFDLAVIDIEMPEVNGIEAAKYVQSVNDNAVIIIVTDHQEYLDEAMDINVYRYLPKPIEKERFFRGLDGALIRYLKVSRPIMLEVDESVIKLTSGDILYLVIENRFVTMHTRTDVIRTKKTMSWWKAHLNPHIFTQCHKSYLVNLGYVTDFSKESVTLKAGKTICKCQCSRRYYPKFRENFFTFIKLNKYSENGGI